LKFSINNWDDLTFKFKTPLKKGDKVKYNGLYSRDRETPIHSACLYKVIELFESNKVMIGRKQELHVVYRCELQLIKQKK